MNNIFKIEGQILTCYSFTSQGVNNPVEIGVTSMGESGKFTAHLVANKIARYLNAGGIEIIDKVIEERKRQNKKWREQNHNTVEWIAIIAEELGEASKQAVDFHFNNGVDYPKNPVPAIVQAERVAQLKEELIQIAATAIQAVESLERQKIEEKPNE